MIVDEGKKEQLVKIQTHLGDAQHSCIRCGAVEDWAKVEIHEQVFANKKRHYKVKCPHCKVFGGYLLQSAMERIFWKGSATAVSEFETSLLLWMKKVGYHGIKKKRIKDAVDRELESRMFTPEMVEDIQISFAEQRKLDEMMIMRGEIEQKEVDIHDLEVELVSDSSTLDYFQVKLKSRQLKLKRGRLIRLKKKLTEMMADGKKTTKRA